MLIFRVDCRRKVAAVNTIFLWLRLRNIMSSALLMEMHSSSEALERKCCRISPTASTLPPKAKNSFSHWRTCFQMMCIIISRQGSSSCRSLIEISSEKLHCDSIFLYKLIQRPRRLPFVVSNAMVDFATATLHECNQPLDSHYFDVFLQAGFPIRLFHCQPRLDSFMAEHFSLDSLRSEQISFDWI